MQRGGVIAWIVAAAAVLSGAGALELDAGANRLTIFGRQVCFLHDNASQVSDATTSSASRTQTQTRTRRAREASAGAAATETAGRALSASSTSAYLNSLQPRRRRPGALRAGATAARLQTVRRGRAASMGGVVLGDMRAPGGQVLLDEGVSRGLPVRERAVPAGGNKHVAAFDADTHVHCDTYANVWVWSDTYADFWVWSDTYADVWFWSDAHTERGRGSNHLPRPGRCRAARMRVSRAQKHVPQNLRHHRGRFQPVGEND
eukprot:CAMPEP_0198726594 /NCGR_PEP_ID=MMETSP1475-20131203/3602_1 /TAXON_ID= ORGANISM="Unidentified sp., Strain CCMP1999" /NCGR_SAMPLE_ID=MMETSP1475 /ASSEMBLY_ACC=CAM_ASM_001111 /LENGTH=260 /DNA_ID=CAMNT_0044488535 /DNA_START=100 /DNA_END=881 /DNA_ORIENTATION=+